MKKKSAKKVLRIASITVIGLCLLAVLGVLAANWRVLAVTKDYILPESELKTLKNVDCVLVLGCGVHDDGSPSDMLADRIAVGVRVYETGITDRLLMSGDHGSENYDEVNAMKSVAVQSGVSPDNVFCDHAGFSTYESMYRAKDIFEAKKVVIVTQGYHLPRAVYDARRLGIDAYGVSADERVYAGQEMRDVREVVARAKDFLWCIFKPEPTYRGEKIPITANGSLTDG